MLFIYKKKLVALIKHFRLFKKKSLSLFITIIAI